MSGSNILAPKPKGWSTTKLRASTLKRLDLLRQGLQEDGEVRPISVDATVNLLVDNYYQKLRV